MSERILVTGATGTVGSELVRMLVEAGCEVKAGTRNPARASEMFDASVEVVQLEYPRPSTFDAAVEWADRVFLTTPPFEPDTHQTLAPFLDWAVQAGTGHVVAISGMGVEVRDDLPVRRLERHIESLGVDYTFLRPNFYMQNFERGFLGERIRRTGSFAMPVEDARVSVVDGRDVAAVAAACLTSDSHAGRAYTLTGPDALTHTEIADHISAAAGVPVTFETVSDEEMLTWLTGAGWSRDLAGAVIALYQSVRAGVRASVSEDVETVLGQPARSFKSFVEEHAASWSQ